MSKIDKFYIAYAYRSYAYPEDIKDVKDSYEEAYEMAKFMLSDDDDSRVWIKVDGDWYVVWHRDEDSGKLVVSVAEVDIRKAFLSEWE